MLRNRRPAPAKLTAFIGEPAIRQVIGDRTIMIDQLDHLVAVAHLANVSVRIVRIGEGWHPGLIGPFLLYRFAQSPSILHFEHFGSSVFVYGKDDIENHAPAVDALDLIALSEQDSIAMITDVIGELEAGHGPKPLAQE